MEGGAGAAESGGSCAGSGPLRWLSAIFKAVQQALNAVGDAVYSSARSIAEALRPQPGPARMLVSANPLMPGLVRHAFTCGYGATDFLSGLAGSCRARLWHWTTGANGAGHRIGGGDEDRAMDQTMCRFTDIQVRPRRFLRQQPYPPGLVSHALHELTDAPTPAARAAVAAMARAVAHAAAAEQQGQALQEKTDDGSSGRLTTKTSESYPQFTYTTSASDMSSDEKTSDEATPIQNPIDAAAAAAVQPVPDMATSPPAPGRVPNAGQSCAGTECGANACNRSRACGPANDNAAAEASLSTDPCCCAPNSDAGGGLGNTAPTDTGGGPGNTAPTDTGGGPGKNTAPTDTGGGPGNTARTDTRGGPGNTAPTDTGGGPRNTAPTDTGGGPGNTAPIDTTQATSGAPSEPSTPTASSAHGP